MGSSAAGAGSCRGGVAAVFFAAAPDGASAERFPGTLATLTGPVSGLAGMSGASVFEAAGAGPAAPARALARASSTSAAFADKPAFPARPCNF